jgi:hypothetical protein
MKMLSGWLLIIAIGLIGAYLTSFIWVPLVALAAWGVVVWAMPRDGDGKFVPLLMWLAVGAVVIALGLLLRRLM